MKSSLLLFLFIGLATLGFAQEEILRHELQADSSLSGMREFNPDSSMFSRVVVMLPGKRGIQQWQVNLAKDLQEAGLTALIFEVSGQQDQSQKLGYLIHWIDASYPNKKVVLLGMEEGVEPTFELITNYTQIESAFIIGGYPGGVRPSSFSKIQCSLTGFFPENYDRAMGQLSFLRRYMHANGKKFEAIVLKDASRNFLTSVPVDGEESSDLEARQEILKEIKHRLIAAK